MTREEFENFVRLVERRFSARPVALRLRIAGLALLGYGGLMAAFAGVGLLSAMFFGLMFYAEWQGKIACAIVGSLILFGGGWAVLKALLVRLEPPEGRPVTRAEAPALFQLLDGLRETLRSKPFHHVLVTGVCNASVVQVPRLGFLGWQRNYLLLGLPLLEGLTTDELKAVLAHEFAHLSKAHARFSHWIYRLRVSWEKVFAQMARSSLQREPWLRKLFLKFVNGFWPRFNAHAFVLSRANEYEADATAARLAGPANIGSALFRIALYNRCLEEKFWPDVWLAANTESAPPAGVYLRLRESLRFQADIPDVVKWSEQIIRLATTNADTHPCFTDRLRKLEIPVPEATNHVRPPGQTAAESLLGSLLEDIRMKVEETWRKESESSWTARHARATSLQHRLTRLDQTAGIALDVDKHWDRAAMLLDLNQDAQATPFLREILTARPDHPAANFHLGRVLLDGDDPAGEALLEKAIALDRDVTNPACELLHAHYRRTGQSEKLRQLDARLDRFEADLAASQSERSTVQASDPLIPHGLSPEELVSLQRTLEAEPDLRAAELARKELRFFPEQRLFLLCVHGRRSWLVWTNADRDQDLVNRLSQSVRLPGRMLVFASGGELRSLARRLRVIPGSAVFSRD